MAEEAREGAGPRQWLLVAAYVVAIAAWLVFSIPRRGTDGTAYWLGQIFGAALIALSIPLLIRLIYWRAKGRRPAFWTPLIFVLAAVLALFFKVSIYAQEETQREDRATAVLESSVGSRSDDVRRCVKELFELDETQHEGPPRLGLSKPQFERLIVRYCREAERRNLFRTGATKEQFDVVFQDVIVSMRQRGELPPATNPG
jgi:hypothetical protein